METKSQLLRMSFIKLFLNKLKIIVHDIQKCVCVIVHVECYKDVSCMYEKNTYLSCLLKLFRTILISSCQRITPSLFPFHFHSFLQLARSIITSKWQVVTINRDQESLLTCSSSCMRRIISVFFFYLFIYFLFFYHRSNTI